jgi:protein O-mannosyl-transferase
MTASGTRGGGSALHRWLTLPAGIAALVAAWTFVVFLPALRNGFVEWDDVRMFLENPYHRGPWGTRLQGAWLTHRLGEYMPVTWTSYALDRTLWDLDAGGYHLTSLALHVLTTLAVYALARRLLGLARGARLDDRGRALAAAVAALAFGVHPLRAEPVGWLSARGTVLGGLLLVLAVLTYLKGWERGRAGGRVPGSWLAGVAGLFVASVLARATGLVLPAVLLVLDVYPLRRLSVGREHLGDREARRVLTEKLGLSILGALAIPMGFLARSSRPLDFWRLEYDPMLAVAWSVYSDAFYVWKTLWPWRLGPIYVMPTRADVAGSEMALAVATVVAITLVALAVRHRWPAALAAWLGYAIILAPLSGLVPFGRLLGVVDRYSYVATIGWAIAAGSVVALAWEARAAGRLPRGGATLGLAAVAVVLLGWSVLTWRQVQIWHDSTSLWARAVAVSPTCVRCHVNLANWLSTNGGGAEALAHYERALSLAPDLVEIHTNVGLLLVRLGRPAEAIPHYEQVLARYPDRLPERVNLVSGLVQVGRLPEAVQLLEDAARTSSPRAQLEYFTGLTRAQPTAPVGWLGLFLAATRTGDLTTARSAHATLAGLHAELASVALQVHEKATGPA